MQTKTEIRSNVYASYVKKQIELNGKLDLQKMDFVIAKIENSSRSEVDKITSSAKKKQRVRRRIKIK